MNKYGDASFYLKGSGTKANKIYAQIPTDGDGDLTFTGSTIRTLVNSSGNWAEIAADLPRLDFQRGACPSLLIEPSRSNLLRQSRALGTSPWTETNATVTANTTVSPDGTTNADTVAFTAVATARINQSYALLTSTTYTFTVWAKVASGTETFRLAYWDGAANQATADLTATTTWQRFKYTFTTAASLPGATIIRILNGTDATAKNIEFWQTDLVQGAYALAPIFTDATALAVTTEDVTLGGLRTKGLIGSTVGSVYIEGKFNVEAGNINLFSLSDGTTNNNIRITSDDIQAISATSSALVSNVFTADADGNWEGKVCITWDGVLISVHTGGATIGTASFTAGASLSQFDLLGKNAPAWFDEIIFYPTALSATDANSITA
jgi:hypothetical protein